MRAKDEFIKEFRSENDDVLLLIREAMGLVSFYRRLLDRFELDALTGLPGSTKFRDYVEGIEKNPPKSVGVVFFDVNGLKEYNDTKGHQAGDLLIQKAAESLHALTENNVNAFRVGGDEFVMIITDRDEGFLNGLLERWRSKLAGLNAANDGIHCAIASGAAFGSGEYILSDVLKLADERMYADKRRTKEATALLQEELYE